MFKKGRYQDVNRNSKYSAWSDFLADLCWTILKLWSQDRYQHSLKFNAKTGTGKKFETYHKSLFFDVEKHSMIEITKQTILNLK